MNDFRRLITVKSIRVSLAILFLFPINSVAECEEQFTSQSKCLNDMMSVIVNILETYCDRVRRKNLRFCAAKQISGLICRNQISNMALGMSCVFFLLWVVVGFVSLYVLSGCELGMIRFVLFAFCSGGLL